MLSYEDWYELNVQTVTTKEYEKYCADYKYYLSTTWADGYVNGQRVLTTEILALLDSVTVDQLKVILESKVNDYCSSNDDLVE